MPNHQYTIKTLAAHTTPEPPWHHTPPVAREGITDSNCKNTVITVHVL